jgi:hypothetical protein
MASPGSSVVARTEELAASTLPRHHAAEGAQKQEGATQI